ncbi:exodeoxyribonuclease V subunit alpha [Marinobacterium rhizophilum]|uniref:RecBCD enzyme subunit RecD n=1 Tax=Marinobacterium rhizophilum TaxID=420402 RepID=A0ABY5HPV2_9GAMM|nr:exodeoxyribonuclease V subunit alpha [Marinobacterium rhizophilum]UTW13822.1 exodeoxyribonuclease V subunit alpha [Marinobacterium rhizophilum]
MQVLQLLQQAVMPGGLRALDVQFARFLHQTGQCQDPSLLLLAALTSFELGRGNVCLPLAAVPDLLRSLAPPLGEQLRPWFSGTPDVTTGGEVLSGGERLTPLVLDLDRLYLQRYWRFECDVASFLLQRSEPLGVDPARLKPSLQRLFGDAGAQPDWQKVAAAAVVNRRLGVISGGPGTGKTTTVIKLLALYIEQQLALGSRPRIRLAAPTGKAAARMAESISAARGGLDLAPEIARLIPQEASTLHRLLGVRPGSRGFRHHAGNPLHLDLLVVDEASMVDLPMMARLLAALPQGARLILIGDRDQLASVEAGSVLGDICSWSGELGYGQAQADYLAQACGLDSAVLQSPDAKPIADSLAQLRTSYRFGADSGIGRLARAVNLGDEAQFQALWREGFADIAWHSLDSAGFQVLIGRCVEGYRAYLQLLAAGASAERVLAAFGRFQLLCALRNGPYGVTGLNERIEQALANAGLITPQGHWYAGRPVIVTRNDGALELFNGDIGIAMPNAEGELRVWFDQGGTARALLPSRMPEHETVYAMTVHKSQGSEFDQTLLLLPGEDAPVLTRELLYTGITRARKTFELYAPDYLLKRVIARRTQRASGLAGRLWG